MFLKSPKIKLIILLLLSPIFSFLMGDAGISVQSEMCHQLGFPIENTASTEDKESSSEDNSVYQLSVHAVNSANPLGVNGFSVEDEIVPNTFQSLALLQELSKKAFLTAHHYHSSYLEGYHQVHSVDRFLLFDTFLI